jgi:hypothetical protein
LLSRTPTQLRLARSLARTTRTQNETETDFPIWSYCVDYFLSISDLTWVFGMMVVLAIFVLVLAMCWFFFFERVGAKA